MKKLNISGTLSLPLEAVTQKLAWLGVTGSGKTYGASKLAEQMLGIGAQIVVLDPVGTWWSLRLSADGKKPSGIQIPIFGGLHGDVPLEPTAGALVANLIVDRGISIIIDVSQFESDAQKARFAADFADRLFFRKKAAPSAMHLFIEEAQEMVPQNPQREENRMLHAFTRMQKLGRNFGIGSSYITQRPQEVNKKALNMAQTLFVFRTTGSQERAAIEKWIDDKSLDLDIAADLPKIATGTCHVWSPEFLKISGTVRISEKETFNGSSTPLVGTTAKARHLAPIDLDRIRTDIQESLDKAKADDPAELRKRIKELEKQVAAKPAKAEKGEKVKIKEKPVITNKQLKRIETILLAMNNCADRHGKAMGMFWSNLDEVSSALLGAFKQVVNHQDKIEGPTKVSIYIPTKNLSSERSPQAKMKAKEVNGERQLDRCAKAVLNVIAQREPNPTSKRMAAILTGYSVGSGGFNNSLSILRSSGYIGGTGEAMSITATGFQAAGEVEPIPTGKELHQMWLTHSRLGKCERMILQTLIESHPEPMSKDEVASVTGYQVTSGGFNNSLSTLRTLELITGSGSALKASNNLF